MDLFGTSALHQRQENVLSGHASLKASENDSIDSVHNLLVSSACLKASFVHSSSFSQICGYQTPEVKITEIEMFFELSSFLS